MMPHVWVKLTVCGIIKQWCKCVDIDNCHNDLAESTEARASSTIFDLDVKV